jgi:hypothetical protein
MICVSEEALWSMVKERRKERKGRIFNINKLKFLLNFSDIRNFYTSTTKGTLLC